MSYYQPFDPMSAPEQGWEQAARGAADPFYFWAERALSGAADVSTLIQYKDERIRAMEKEVGRLEQRVKELEAEARTLRMRTPLQKYTGGSQ